MPAYSEKYKKKAVVKYKETGKFMDTAREFKISKNTLKKWLAEIPVGTVQTDAEKLEAREALIVQHDLKKALTNESLMRAEYMGEFKEPLTILTNKAITKAVEMLPKCKNLSEVTRLLEILLRHYENMKPEDDSTKDKDISTIRQSIININVARQKTKPLEVTDAEEIN